MASKLRIVLLILGMYSVFVFLDPLGQSASRRKARGRLESRGLGLSEGFPRNPLGSLERAPLKEDARP